MQEELFSIRQNYNKACLDFESFGDDPFAAFQRWLQNAISQQIAEPTAMSLSTATANGRCSSRIVLLKCLDNSGFCFFTNYESAKANQLAENNWAAMLFFWPELEQQIRIEGEIEKCDSILSDVYFNQRPEESRISAIVSPQSKTIPSKDFLTEKVRDFKNAKTEIKRPDYWGGYRLVPQFFEFWQGRPNRLHDRIIFELNSGIWEKNVVAP